ncbi:MAG TPA: hypothetical protein PLD27_07790 [bacterium]|mgnify:CR=1 FL=1|nr:hypothetical protein [bacterium]HOL47529.1 hypothetical protein [bacterium]HPQ19119.1 hypothetical protein [bacterium]
MACKYKYVFLLGRPGCGKSAVYRQIEKRAKETGLANSFERVDDFPKLWNKFQSDNKLEEQGKKRKYSVKTADGGYLVTNDGVWDEILKELNDDIINKSREDHLIFIEFSRPNYIHSLKNFSKKILNEAIVVYIDVDFDTCWARNVARHEKALAEGTDDHLVSRDEMEKTYKYDDGQELIKKQPIPVIRVDNQKEGEEHLIKEVEKVIEQLKCK